MLINGDRYSIEIMDNGKGETSEGSGIIMHESQEERVADFVKVRVIHDSRDWKSGEMLSNHFSAGRYQKGDVLIVDSLAIFRVVCGDISLLLIRGSDVIAKSISESPKRDCNKLLVDAPQVVGTDGNQFEL